jgi:hypothetical protein
VRSELALLFEDCAAYDRHPMNKLRHTVGVASIIIFTLVGLLSKALRLLHRTGTSGIGPLGRIPPGLCSPARWTLRLRKESAGLLKNLQQLLYGPLWLIGAATSRKEGSAAPSR